MTIKITSIKRTDDVPKGATHFNTSTYEFFKRKEGIGKDIWFVWARGTLMHADTWHPINIHNEKEFLAELIEVLKPVEEEPIYKEAVKEIRGSDLVAHPNEPTLFYPVSSWIKSGWNVCDIGNTFIFKSDEENIKEDIAKPDSNKYKREIKPDVFIDVYDVLKAFNVKDPSLQHLIKKALAAGQRGHKDTHTDLKDIVASAKRALEMYEEFNK